MRTDDAAVEHCCRCRGNRCCRSSSAPWLRPVDLPVVTGESSHCLGRCRTLSADGTIDRLLVGTTGLAPRPILEPNTFWRHLSPFSRNARPVSAWKTKQSRERKTKVLIIYAQCYSLIKFAFLFQVRRVAAFRSAFTCFMFDRACHFVFRVIFYLCLQKRLICAAFLLSKHVQNAFRPGDKHSFSPAHANTDRSASHLDTTRSWKMKMQHPMPNGRGHASVYD